MSEIVLRLEETIPDISHELLGAPTINVGTITGGEKVNIIPASCVIEVDRRTIPGETDESVVSGIEEAIAKAKERFPDIDASVEIAFNAQPFEVPGDSSLVQHALAAAGEALGREVETIGFRGASDARFMADAGAEVILCGPGDITLAHTAREHIVLDELAEAALVYAGAFSRILGAR
jgi:acetylornithine deacetylase/succinyl-diaminopimelate desuccinylase-like protein